MDNAFRANLSLAHEYLEGYTKLSLSEIQERIQEAYENDEISGTQYDYIMGLIND